MCALIRTIQDEGKQLELFYIKKKTILLAKAFWGLSESTFMIKEKNYETLQMGEIRGKEILKYIISKEPDHIV